MSTRWQPIVGKGATSVAGDNVEQMTTNVGLVVTRLDGNKVGQMAT